VKSTLPNLSHIYVEKDALGYSLAESILTKYGSSKMIEINNYKEIFNRSNQNFQLQKSSMKLILALKRPPYLYPVSSIVQEFDSPNVYYTTPVINCLYNCDYCFLQGMYPSGNIVLFVNENDFFENTLLQIKKRENKKPLYLSISYNTDLMAMENILPICRNWISFSSSVADLFIEIRTKSGLFSSINDISANENTILSWTLSPEPISRKYESTAPPLKSRLSSIRSAIKKGWKVRLCFDPIITVNDWQVLYKNFFSDIFKKINPDKLYDVTIGVFRMNKEYFNRIKKTDINSDLYFSNYESEDGVLSLPKKYRINVINLVRYELEKYLDKDKVHSWEI